MSDLKTAARPPSALRILDTALWVVLPLLAAFTIAMLFFAIVRPLFGDGSIYVQGSTEAVVVEYTSTEGEVTRHDLINRDPRSIPEGNDQYFDFLSVNAQGRVMNAGAKLVLALATLVDLALAWAAYIAVRGITRSSLRGEVFTTNNAKRVGRLGALAITYPLAVWVLGESVLNSVLDTELLGVAGLRVSDGVGGGKLWVGVGLLLLTLARSFRWGVELQELERATI